MGIPFLLPGFKIKLGGQIHDIANGWGRGEGVRSNCAVASPLFRAEAGFQAGQSLAQLVIPIIGMEPGRKQRNGDIEGRRRASSAVVAD